MANYNTPSPATRSDAIRAWNRLQKDPEFIADFMAGKSDALAVKRSIDTMLANSGGGVSGPEYEANQGDGFDDAATQPWATKGTGVPR